MCPSSVTHVAKFARHAAGGSGSPNIEFLDRFAKTYGTNRVVGKDVFAAVADWDVSGFECFNHIHVAVVATNLTAPADSLLNKQDLEGLKIKTKRPVAEAVHADMENLRAACEKLYSELGVISQQQSDEHWGHS